MTEKQEHVVRASCRGSRARASASTARSRSIEGQVTLIAYGNPGDRSLVQVYTKHEQDLRAAGFQLMEQ